MSHTFNIHLGPGISSGTGSTSIYIGCTFESPHAPTRSPGMAPTRLPGMVARSPQLDPGGTNIIDPNNNELLGIALTYISTIQNVDTEEHWVAKNSVALGKIQSGDFKLRWARVAQDWNLERVVLKQTWPSGKFASMPCKYKPAPPPAEWPADKSSVFRRYKIENGPSVVNLSTRGGLFREQLSQTEFIDHWRLFPDYAEPNNQNNYETHVVPLNTTDTLYNFMNSLKDRNGEYVCVSYKWEDL